MVLVSFDTILYVISGPLEARLNNLMNILLISELYNNDFRIIWCRTQSCRLSLSDIYVSGCFRGKLIEDVADVKKSDNYFYNPRLPLNMILSNTIPLNTVEKVRETNVVKTYDWLVIDNLNGSMMQIMQIKTMLPYNLIPHDIYTRKIKDLYASMTTNSNVEGYVNLFKKKNLTSCVYIDDMNKLDEYDNIINELVDRNTSGVFVVIGTNKKATNSQTDPDDRNNKQVLHERYGGKITMIKDTQHGYLLNFMCARECKLICCLHDVDEYIQEVARSCAVIVYVWNRGECMNVNLTQIYALTRT